MSTAELTEEVKLITLLDKNHQFKVTDGVTRFMIHGLGTVSATDLRIIANEIDQRNNTVASDINTKYYDESVARLSKLLYLPGERLKVVGTVIDVSMVIPKYLMVLTEDDVAVRIAVEDKFDQWSDDIMDLFDKSNVDVIAIVTENHGLTMNSVSYENLLITEKGKSS